MNYQYKSIDELFDKQEKDRKERAKLSFDEKLQAVVQMQRLNYALKKAGGKKVSSMLKKLIEELLTDVVPIPTAGGSLEEARFFATLR